VIKGQTIEGRRREEDVALRVGPPATTAASGLADAGRHVLGLGDTLKISGVKFGTRAKKAGIDQGYDVASVAVPSGGRRRTGSTCRRSR
jgi:hypothetical protein